jgi:hypothetical protein
MENDVFIRMNNNETHRPNFDHRRADDVRILDRYYHHRARQII